jgi:diguanylate cyclase (GGDEF)-like protein
MNFSFAANYTLGSCLVVILILIDYIRKYNTDFFQRRIFINILVLSLVGMAISFLYYGLRGRGSGGVQTLLFCAMTIYYLIQSAAYFYVFVLIDYLSYGDIARTRITARISWIMLILHAVILVLNMRVNFYFFINNDNIFARGDLHYIRYIVNFAPAFFSLIDMIIPSASYKRSQFFMLMLFLVFTGTGSMLDAVFHSDSRVWPCFTAALLYAYFFIIRSDSKIDSLTGIGNRYSFNEFINRITQQGTPQPWSLVMIDIDHFKQINDTLGHLEGDNALRDLASIIKGSVRHSDFVARYGGDEFILAARADYDINRILARLQESIDAQNEKGGRPYKIEISHGSDLYIPGSGRSLEEFLTHLDKLMYQHKSERRRARGEAGV